MKLSLRMRVLVIPLILMVFSCVFLVGVSLVLQKIMWKRQVEDISSSQIHLALKSMDSLKGQAMTIAAMAAGTPGVQEAYLLAGQGYEDEGRLVLRESFDQLHEKVTKTLGISAFKVHFHLPPAKSFLRIWRKPGKKDGGDDLSSFRRTVLKVNQDKAKVGGIEIGRGGFVIRGLVPVIGEKGNHLGSVEGLIGLNQIFETAKISEADEVAVYMLESELAIARKLQEKNLPITGNMARVFSSAKGLTDPYIDASFLSRVTNAPVRDKVEDRLLTALPINDFSGKQKGVLVYVTDASEELAMFSKINWALYAGGGLFIVIVSLFLYITSSFIVKALAGSIHSLEDSSCSVMDSSGEISSSSNSLAEGATEQAAALEETSAAMEETSSMTRRNADNANEADSLMKDANQVIGKASDSMDELTVSMKEISEASEEISKIIKTIDEIAFQTNLLALNAAVEAAPAGEAGAGFAVVADEVRSLALRSNEAASSTAALIESTVHKVGSGEKIVQQTNNAFSEVARIGNSVGEIVGEITAASNEQAKGIEEINKAMTEMGTVTDRNAATAEESAAASSELAGQAEQLQNIVMDLHGILNGTGGGAGFVSRKQKRVKKDSVKPSRPARASSRREQVRIEAPRKEKNRAEDMIPFDDDDFQDF